MVFIREIIYKKKNEVYVKHCDEHSDIGTHWVILYVQNNDATYFDSFRREHIPNEIRTFMNHKNKDKYFQNTSI